MREKKTHSKRQFYGLKDGLLKHISEVETGLQCKCICPSCNEILVAKNSGTIKIHHFSHYTNQECMYGAQTSIHLAAKEILTKVKVIRVPKVEKFVHTGIKIDYDKFLSIGEFIRISDDFLIPIDEVILEKKLHNYIPDIVIISNGRKLIVEIAVTHFVGRSKLKLIKGSQISAIEIDLSSLKHNFNHDQLEKILAHDVEQKTWLHNQYAEKT